MFILLAGCSLEQSRPKEVVDDKKSIADTIVEFYNTRGFYFLQISHAGTYQFFLAMGKRSLVMQTTAPVPISILC